MYGENFRMVSSINNVDGTGVDTPEKSLSTWSRACTLPNHKSMGFQKIKLTYLENVLMKFCENFAATVTWVCLWCYPSSCPASPWSCLPLYNFSRPFLAMTLVLLLILLLMVSTKAWINLTAYGRAWHFLHVTIMSLWLFRRTNSKSIAQKTTHPKIRQRLCFIHKGNRG